MKKLLPLLVLFAFTLLTINAEDVTVTVNGAKIKGTLEIPKSDKPVDVVLIIAGSGPTDRDGNTPLIPGKNNSLKMLAGLFAKNGVASLRFDKRSIGASDKVKEADLTFETYINDAVELVKFLRSDKRFAKIIVAGHSEGSLIGMIAANQAKADKYISLCGAGKPIYTILEEQMLVKNQMPDDLVKQFRVIIDSLKQGNTVKNINPAFNNIFRTSVQPYLISWFKYSPCVEIAKLNIPILVIGGTTDLQVEAEDAEMLAKACKNSKLMVIEDMNHILKEVATNDRKINFESYSNPDLPLSEGLCKALIDFVK